MQSSEKKHTGRRTSARAIYRKTLGVSEATRPPVPRPSEQQVKRMFEMRQAYLTTEKSLDFDIRAMENQKSVLIRGVTT